MFDFLHITNGDDAANIIKESAIQGDVLPWRDTMHYGPFPGELDLDEVSLIRANYFGGDSKDSYLDVERDFKLRNEHLKAASRYQEVILWYEHDLLDQLQILQLLDWFGQNRDQTHQLSMICIDQFAGIDPFRGIGQLSCKQMESLFDSRLPVTEEQISISERGWKAFRAPIPTELEHFIQSDDHQAIPFLNNALLRHLQEYPYTSDGLNRTERQILTLIANGHQTPNRIFAENMAMETTLFIGDWTTYRIMGDLCNCEQPLISCKSGDMFNFPSVTNTQNDKFNQQTMILTPLGEQVINDNKNTIHIIDRDFWLGGVHIHTQKSMWMWDNINCKIVLKTV